MTALELEMGGMDGDPTGLGKETGIKIRVFINMDEDDDGDKNINLKSLFNVDPTDKPYNIEVSSKRK